MNNKKIFLLALVAVLCSAFIFSETTYVVKSVTGKVEVETVAGKWEKVTVGMKLSPAAVINTGLNSKLVVTIDDDDVTVKAMKKGTVEKLCAEFASGKSGIKIGAKTTNSDAAEDKGTARTNVSTASTRASEATEDIDWAE